MHPRWTSQSRSAFSLARRRGLHGLMTAAAVLSSLAAGTVLLAAETKPDALPQPAAPAKPNAARHWAFKAPQRAALPEVKNKAAVRNDIDRFILARLDQEGLKLSPEADKITLLRRLSLDLTGLPPGVKEVEAFLADSSPDAYEKQV